jgi:hypothetical protein
MGGLSGEEPFDGTVKQDLSDEGVIAGGPLSQVYGRDSHCA